MTYYNFLNKIKSVKRVSVIGVACAILLTVMSCKRKAAEEKAGPLRENHLPVIFAVNVSPSRVTQASPITLKVNASDPDGDPVNLKYRWLLNGEEIPITTNTLSQDEFKKGDSITVFITPDDGKDEGDPYRVDIVVSNLPPEVKNIEFSPPSPTVRDNIKVIANAVDPEGDPVHLRYAWFVDSVQVEGIEGDTLPNSYLKKGASVVVEVIPSDDESTGPSLVSQEITIANSPPKITSVPPDSVSGNRYTYQVIATDPDGDPITFLLENSPEGMSINPKTGLLNWQFRPEEKGEYSFTVIAEDIDGARATQTITLGY